MRFAFEPFLEAEFENATSVKRSLALRRFLVSVAVVMAACLLLDLHAGQIRLGIIVRLLVQVPLLLAAAWIMKHRIPVWLEGVALGLPVISVVAGTALLSLAMDDFYRSRYLMATVLFLYTVNVGIPIRFRQARTISIASLVTYAVIVLFGVTRAPAGANADLVAFTTVVVLASLMITFRSEVAKRESFLLHLRERLSSEELQRVNRRLLMLSQTDALTSVFNRRFFDGAAHQARAEALRDGTWLSLMMIDVDYFKLLNDSLGHAEGDACLQLIARAIRDHVRAEDLVSRYGGEEFVVILPAATPFEATFVAERVRTAVEGLHYANPARREPVTVSIGVVAVAAEAKATIVELVKSADDALYAAKSAGRNRVFSASVPFVPAFGETKQVPRSLAEPVDV